MVFIPAASDSGELAVEVVVDAAVEVVVAAAAEVVVVAAAIGVGVAAAAAAVAVALDVESVDTCTARCIAQVAARAQVQIVAGIADLNAIRK